MIKETQIFTNKDASKFLRTSNFKLWRGHKGGKIAICPVTPKPFTWKDLEAYLYKKEAFSVK